jgi:hypothetical protein
MEWFGGSGILPFLDLIWAGSGALLIGRTLLYLGAGAGPGRTIKLSWQPGDSRHPSHRALDWVMAASILTLVFTAF